MTFPLPWHNRIAGAWLLVCASLYINPCGAQDRRVVVEPVIPPSCAVLRASLMLEGGKVKAGDETSLDTARIQRALDSCPAGKAVQLEPSGSKTAFLSSPLHLPTGVTLRIDAATTLVASRDARLYDVQPGSCGVVNDRPEGCQPLISVHGAPHAAIVGEGAIDGRGGEKILNQTVSWWDLAEQARAGGRQQVPRLIVADGSDDFTLYRITLRNSPNFHVVYRNGRGFTAWNLKIDTPRTARNTDGVDPVSAEDITVTHSFIRTGDDNIAIKGSGSGVSYMTVRDNHFYSGHGMSIGSETFGGVHDIRVQELSLDGSDNGIRIKSNASRGGLVENVTYSNICIHDSKRPIDLDTHYDNPGDKTDLYPEFRSIRLENVRISGGGRIRVEGYDRAHRIALSLDGVLLDDATRYGVQAAHATIVDGPKPVNLTLTGEDVAVSRLSPSGTVDGCSAMFVPFEQARP